ncbi:MAG: hypothetical protein ACFFED_11970 [Candidatus Thorarchaeota archaeon]
MDLKHGAIIIAAGLTWSLYLLGQIAISSAVGLSTILWMVFAVSCTLGSKNENEQSINAIAERDIL